LKSRGTWYNLSEGPGGGKRGGTGSGPPRNNQTSRGGTRAVAKSRRQKKRRCRNSTMTTVDHQRERKRSRRLWQSTRELSNVVRGKARGAIGWKTTRERAEEERSPQKKFSKGIDVEVIEGWNVSRQAPLLMGWMGYAERKLGGFGGKLAIVRPGNEPSGTCNLLGEGWGPLFKDN